MRAHASSDAIHGFTMEVAEADLQRLRTERGVLFTVDSGSGNLIDFTAYGLAPEPTIRGPFATLNLVTFSGDQLLRTIQCGIVARRRDLILRVWTNPPSAGSASTG